MKDEEIYNASVNQWGDDFNITVAIGELAELITAITDWQRGRHDIKPVMEEIVDVQLMLNQLRNILDAEPMYKALWRYKVDRLKQRLEGGIFDPKKGKRLK